MAEVLAGWIVGFALSIAVSPLGAWAMINANQQEGFARRIAPPGTNVVALSVALHLAALLIFTALGMVLGLALAGIEDRRPDGGLGSPNVVYTTLVIALTAVLVIPTLALPAARRYAVAAAVTFALAFGWAMPWLAMLGD